MTDWVLATEIFAGGIAIVMLVMVILILTIKATSFVVQRIERRLAKAKE